MVHVLFDHINEAIPVRTTIQKTPVHQLIIKKIQRPRPTLLRFSTVVTWLYFVQSIFETKNYSWEKICRSCRLSIPNYVLNTHRLDQVYRSPVPECRLEEVTPYLPSKEPVLHYAGFEDGSGIGSVRTIERVLWRNGVNNGRTDWGVIINYMGDVAYRSSLTDVRSNIFITIQIPATLVATWKQVNKLCRRHSEVKQMESQSIFSENQTMDLSEIYVFSPLPSTPTCIFSSIIFFCYFCFFFLFWNMFHV